MTDADRAQRSVAEHVQWCHEERDRLTAEIAKFMAGTKCIGEPRIGQQMTQGSRTQVAYLRRSIEQLDRVILAYPEYSIGVRG